jgi:putative ABC transport system permease protein
MGMAVVERTVEIGTLRAMGLHRAGLRRIFVLEGLALGLIGALAGLLLALALAQGLELLGLTWLPPGYVDPMPLSIKIWGQWTLIACTLAGLTLIATVSAWWPARRAAHFEIVDALRHV